MPVITPKRPFFVKQEHLDFMACLRGTVPNSWAARAAILARFPSFDAKKAEDLLGYWLETH